MRIISNFHDYYDVVGKYDGERKLIWERKSFSIDLKRNPKIPKVTGFYSSKSSSISEYIVGFCGKLYGILRWRGEYDPYNHTPKKEIFCFNIEDFDEAVAKNEKSDIIKNYYLNDLHKPKWNTVKFQRRDIIKFLADIDDYNKTYHKFLNNLFVDNRSPCYSYYYDNYKQKYIVDFNIKLAEFEFYRVFPPYQAYQEISMFYNNLAEDRKVIPPISDEVMAEIKGFDKYSFRKAPSKK